MIPDYSSIFGEGFTQAAGLVDRLESNISNDSFCGFRYGGSILIDAILRRKCKLVGIGDFGRPTCVDFAARSDD